jgi:hypothetical protein
MASPKLLPKFEVAAAIVSFALIFVCGLAGQVAIRPGAGQRTVEAVVKCAILLLFFVFGLSCIGLMIHAFVVLQIHIGNGALPLVRLLADHETV